MVVAERLCYATLENGRYLRCRKLIVRLPFKLNMCYSEQVEDFQENLSDGGTFCNLKNILRVWLKLRAPNLLELCVIKTFKNLRPLIPV